LGFKIRIFHPHDSTKILDFFASTRFPKIAYTPSFEMPHKIEVEVNDWIFPKGGVVFVWMLKQETSRQFLQRLKVQPGA
jgi:hypothetical protein